MTNILCKIGLHRWQYKTDIDTFRYRRCKNPNCPMYRWQHEVMVRNKPW